MQEKGYRYLFMSKVILVTTLSIPGYKIKRIVKVEWEQY